MSRRRGFGKASAAGAVFALVSASAALLLWLCFADGFPAESVKVEIPEGSGLFSIAEKLETEGAVRKAELFSLLSFLRGTRASLKHGEYEFPPAATLGSVHEKLLRGEVLLRKVTFPEGSTLAQMAAVLDASGVVSRARFLPLARNGAYAAEKLGTDVADLEGFLFPDTYFFPKNSSAEKVVETMLGRFREVCAALGMPSEGARAKEIVTAASLIEKETSFGPEKPLVSAVIRNRLRRGMRLEFDPTVIYALGEDFDGNLRKRDLRFRSPYNTYVVSGLPPGPIAAPGLESLRAAVSPADSDYLYFVSDGEGKHVFSTNYRDHRRAVKKMLKKARAKRR